MNIRKDRWEDRSVLKDQSNRRGQIKSMHPQVRRVLQEDVARPKNIKKNTRRWCKGKVGTHHNYQMARSRSFGRLLIWRCVNCGKEVGRF